MCLFLFSEFIKACGRELNNVNFLYCYDLSFCTEILQSN